MTRIDHNRWMRWPRPRPGSRPAWSDARPIAPVVACLVSFSITGGAWAAEERIKSQGATLTVHADDGRWLSLRYEPGGKTHAIAQPLAIDVDGDRIEGRYEQAVVENGELGCEGSLTSRRGTTFRFRDRYRASARQAFDMEREVEVVAAGAGDTAFNSLFHIDLGRETAFGKHEYFVPGLWYRTNFTLPVAGSLASDPNDRYFLFREDRLPLPVVAARDRASGDTVALTHVQADPTTFAGDQGPDPVVDERLQFGSLGVVRRDQLSLAFMFPGSEGEKNRTPGGKKKSWALRSHPVRAGVVHRYRLMMSATTTASYPALVEHAWKQAFDRYRPKLRRVDLPRVCAGLIETLDYYFVGKSAGYDAPGFPFSVYLPSGDVRAYNYQMGFVGRQIPNAFFLIHEGIAQARNDWRAKGTAIVNFWAQESLCSDGWPRTWYDPAREPGKKGRWRPADNRHGGTAMRVAATGMEGMLSAWLAMREARNDRPAWLAACRRFGDWLVSNQNEDGSFFLAYGPLNADGRREPTESSKAASCNPIRFLVALYQATDDERYLQAARRAGEYCLEHSHQPYFYAGSVVDNPVTPDRESGQEAMAAYLALRDATKEKRWLEAAVQAARYTETWMMAYEVPAVADGPQGFPADRSIVGQTVIATGHSAADLGLAFSTYDYYRLYLFTGDEHFLDIARLLLHNTKQALNWDGSLYPDLPRGLQLEAFSVTMPRRKGVMECLSWNYAAHLDPLMRFKDRFGDIDLDVIEKLPLDERRKLND